MFTNWSQGNAWTRPDGLDFKCMNKGFGGKQVESKESTLTANCWGPFNYPNMLPKPAGNKNVQQSICLAKIKNMLPASQYP